MLVAKKGFSPLEQYATGGSIGPWTDVYAMCATIVYCVTGRLIPTPMDRVSGVELDLSGFTHAFAETLEKGLGVRPEERTQTMGELEANLCLAINPETAVGRECESREKGTRWEVAQLEQELQMRQSREKAECKATKQGQADEKEENDATDLGRIKEQKLPLILTEAPVLARKRAKNFARCYYCMQELDRPDGRCPHCGHDNPTTAKMQASHALPCGSLLHERYVIGYARPNWLGITYIGWDLGLKTRICIKEFYPDWIEHRNAPNTAVNLTGELEKWRDCYLENMHKAARIQNLCAVEKSLDIFCENGTAYFVTDYIEGINLNTHLRKTRKLLTEEACISMFSPLMRDMEELHAQGIFHQNICPGNLILKQNGALVLKNLGVPVKEMWVLYQEAYPTLLYTEDYFFALEMHFESKMVGPQTDIYSICATIAYCISGCCIPRPMNRIMGTELDLSSFSPAFAEVLKKGLSIRPEDRIQSMADLMEKFSSAIESKAVSNPPPAPTTTPEPKPGTSPMTAPNNNPNPKTNTRPKALKKRLGWIFTAAGAAVLAGAILLFPLKAYREAQTLLTAHQYSQAATAFEELGFFLKAAEYAKEARYAEAEQLLSAKMYKQAILAFKNLGDYKDSKEKTENLQNSLYAEGKRLFEKGRLEQAYEYFTQLGDYLDAQALAERAAAIAAVVAEPKEPGSRWGTAYVKKLQGGYSNTQVSLDARTASQFNFTGPIKECTDISLDFKLNEHSGDCLGLWMLYLQEGGTLIPAAQFLVDENSCEELKTYCFHFNIPQTFSSAVVAPTGKDFWGDYSYTETCIYYTPVEASTSGEQIVFSGHFGEEEWINGVTVRPYILDQPEMNSDSISQEIIINSYTGNPFGDWDICIRDLDGKWNNVGSIAITKDNAAPNVITTFNCPFKQSYSFDAIAICPKQWMKYTMDWSVIFMKSK